GLRNEQFKNYNGMGEVYSKQRHQLAPRLGLSWDVFGDSSFKVYANAGRYHLAIPASTAIRGASGQYFAVQYGVFDGISENGVPINFQPIEDPVYQNGAEAPRPIRNRCPHVTLARTIRTNTSSASTRRSARTGLLVPSSRIAT